MKKYQSFFIWKVSVLEVKFSKYVKRRVFVMLWHPWLSQNVPSECAGWSESSLGTHLRWYVFWRSGSFVSKPSVVLVCINFIFLIFWDYDWCWTLFILMKRYNQMVSAIIMWAKTSSGLCGKRRPRSACAFARSGQGLCCPQTESLHTIEYFNGEQMPGWDFAHVPDDVNPHILRMLEDTFSLGVAHVNPSS